MPKPACAPQGAQAVPDYFSHKVGAFSFPPCPPAQTRPLLDPPPQAVTDYFNRKVEEAARGAPAGDLSAEGVLAVIRQHSRGWRRDRLRPFPELRFTYEEGESGGWGGLAGWGGRFDSGGLQQAPWWLRSWGSLQGAAGAARTACSGNGGMPLYV